MYTNADQFLNKHDELQMFITGNEPDIILISEVLPKSHCNSVSSSRLSLNGYNMLFNFDPDGCQPNTNIRGVGIYISKRISVSEYYFTGSNFRDHIWISMSLKGCDSLLIGCIYRSPSCELLSSTNSLCELLKSIPSDKFSHILICGDFNYPSMDWLLPSASAHCEQLFLDAVQDLYLFQHVLETTRKFNRNSFSSLLDLVFTNEAGMISDIQYLPDHVCLKFELICYGK